MGRREESRRLLDELKERATRGDVSPFDFAEACAGMADVDLTLEYLERSLDLRVPEFIAIGCDPLFDSVRNEPRFQKLLVAIGLAAPT